MSSNDKKLPFAFRAFRAAVPVLETLAPFMAKQMAFKAFFFPYRYNLPPKEIDLAEKARTIAFEFNGLKIHGYEWGGEGSGPRVLLMHGWSSRTTQFIYLVEKLVKSGYRVVGFDAPGHGYSDGKHADVIQFGNCLVEFVKIIGTVDYAVGHSLGGSAIVLAHKLGFRAKKFCFLATPTDANDILEVARLKMNASVKTRENLRQEIRDRYKDDLANYTANALALGQQLPPTLLIYDKDDNEAPPRHGEQLQSAIPDSILEFTEGLGHTRILKDAAVISRVINWLQN